MDGQVVKGVLVLGGAVVMASVVLGLLHLFLPGCSDIASRSPSILCIGGLGEPTGKTPLVFLLVTLVTGTVIWERIK